ncbi:hypothetical protein GPECTOR_20g462 [Gonium pectorale]|uniref:Uncharacterized protein n=1 Tax=Gonium pectorale TaxID=33097 RepID=A0A150GIF6_GONPE|nr:hypothetical protein GPECTOR_20g462 [Gonium pectorale]|eukprot:KXZ49606.1 hypothetical protein GPECTOR_20g462 [Gonium pectorale]
MPDTGCPQLLPGLTPHALDVFAAAASARPGTAALLYGMAAELQPQAETSGANGGPHGCRPALQRALAAAFAVLQRSTSDDGGGGADVAGSPVALLRSLQAAPPPQLVVAAETAAEAAAAEMGGAGGVGRQCGGVSMSVAGMMALIPRVAAVLADLYDGLPALTEAAAASSTSTASAAGSIDNGTSIAPGSASRLVGPPLPAVRIAPCVPAPRLAWVPRVDASSRYVEVMFNQSPRATGGRLWNAVIFVVNNGSLSQPIASLELIMRNRTAPASVPDVRQTAYLAPYLTPPPPPPPMPPSELQARLAALAEATPVKAIKRKMRPPPPPPIKVATAVRQLVCPGMTRFPLSYLPGGGPLTDRQFAVWSVMGLRININTGDVRSSAELPHIAALALEWS